MERGCWALAQSFLQGIFPSHRTSHPVQCGHPWARWCLEDEILLDTAHFPGTCGSVPLFQVLGELGLVAQPACEQVWCLTSSLKSPGISSVWYLKMDTWASAVPTVFFLEMALTKSEFYLHGWIATLNWILDVGCWAFLVCFWFCNSYNIISKTKCRGYMVFLMMFWLCKLCKVDTDVCEVIGFLLSHGIRCISVSSDWWRFS